VRPGLVGVAFCHYARSGTDDRTGGHPEGTGDGRPRERSCGGTTLTGGGGRPLIRVPDGLVRRYAIGRAITRPLALDAPDPFIDGG
jgi:hypothetical protein